MWDLAWSGPPPLAVPAATDCLANRGDRARSARGGCVMCESRVLMATPEGEQVVLDDVTAMLPESDGFLLTTLFGEQKHVRAKIKVIDLLKHRIILEPVP